MAQEEDRLSTLLGHRNEYIAKLWLQDINHEFFERHPGWCHLIV